MRGRNGHGHFTFLAAAARGLRRGAYSFGLPGSARNLAAGKPPRFASLDNPPYPRRRCELSLRWRGTKHVPGPRSHARADSRPTRHGGSRAVSIGADGVWRAYSSNRSQWVPVRTKCSSSPWTR